MKPLSDATVAVVGLGLMGGSLAGALRGQCGSVVGVARRAETLETAVSRRLVDCGTTDLTAGVVHADIVVLAAPVRAILRLLREVTPLLPDGCLVMDLGSTKSAITAEMARLPGCVEPLGGHPMCGREVSGIAAADPTLYRGRPFILTPLSRTSETALSLGLELVIALGARPLILDAERHDRLAAAVSHLPYLLACALTSAVEDAATSDSMVWELAASGFRDTSRLAASDVTMMLDILLTNREAVLRAVKICEGQLRSLVGLVEASDEEGLRAALAAIQEHRPGQSVGTDS